LTLRQLVLIYDQKLLDSWDHTAYLYSITYNLLVVVSSALSKGGKAKIVTAAQCHPYRENKESQGDGLKVTHDNFEALKHIIGGLAAGKRRRA
jgi:hypothetical protein